MNKIKCLLFTILVVVIAFEQCNSEQMHLSKMKNHLNVKHYHLKTKHEYLAPHFERLQRECPGFSEKFLKADKKYEECAPRVLEDRTTTMCTKMEKLFLNCLDNNYRKVIDDCGSENARGVFSLLMKSFVSGFKYLCKQTGETIIELSRSCLWDDLEVKDNLLQQCEETIKNKAGWYNNNGFATTIMCRDAKEFRDCIETRVTMTCTCPKTKQAFAGLYDAMIAPCDNITTN